MKILTSTSVKRGLIRWSGSKEAFPAEDPYLAVSGVLFSDGIQVWQVVIIPCPGRAVGWGEEVASLQVSDAEALRKSSVHTDMLCCRSWDCHWLRSFLHLPLSLTRAGISPLLLLPSVFGEVGFHLFGKCMQIINILYWSTSLANSVSSHFYHLWLSFILSFKIFVSLYLILPSS